MTFLLKKWDVLVNGHAPVIFDSATRGKATAAAWRAYQSSYDCTFKRFLEISTITRSERTVAHYGEPITVSGKPAFFVGYAGGNSLSFVRGGSDLVMLTHELDAVLPWETTEQTDVSISE